MILALFLSLACGCGGASQPDTGEVELDSLAYVGGVVCASCHQAEAQAWTGSDHDRAMEVATPSSVRGDFENVSLTTCGVTTRFFRRGDAYLVNTVGPDGRTADFQITHTFGTRPLQQYLITFPDGRRQALTIAWDVEAERWFSLYGDECVSHDDWLHWTGGAMNWNYMCASCHSTALQRNFQLATNEYHTAFAEIDVSCEACHGPGELHVAWAEGEEAVPDTPGAYGLTVDLSLRASARTELDTCAPCHSRRREAYPGFVPGRAYLDHFEPALLEEGLYFADGQIQDEVFVYGSYVQSKMHAAGVRCSSCHDPHALTPRLEGNALCVQCHVPDVYDVPEHLRHAPLTEGAACVDCHMPARTYMVVDPRRDHRFGVPRPDLTVEIGVPNACNQCHAHRSPEWAAEYVEDWYGRERSDSTSVGLSFAAARVQDPVAEEALQRIVESPDRPAVVRATALQLLQAYGSDETEAVRQRALLDAEPLVRTIAIRTIDQTGATGEARATLRALAADSVRLVRMEAGRVLVREGGTRLTRPAGSDSAIWRAVSEYREGQLALAEQPASHLNLAVLHEGAGAFHEAAEAYRTALRLDSSFVPAHLNLAMLLDRERLQALDAGNQALADSLHGAAERALKTAVNLQPDLAEARYSLALLIAEDPDRLPEAAGHLRAAAALAPEDARIQYNAGLAHQQLGEVRQAESFLLAAYRLEDENADFLNALSIFYMQQQRWEEADRFTRTLSRRYPQNPDLQRRMAYIQRQQ